MVNYAVDKPLNVVVYRSCLTAKKVNTMQTQLKPFIVRINNIIQGMIYAKDEKHAEELAKIQFVNELKNNASLIITDNSFAYMTK